MAEEEHKKKTNGKNGRVVFIDQARAIALTMMMVGHSLDHFLGEPWRSGEVYQEYQFFRGITSALFLMVSGFSFVVASFKYWDDYVRFSPRFLARMRRIAYVLFFAYLLHMYGGTLTQLIVRYTPAKIEGFLRFDVLQNIGFSLLLVHLVAFLVRKREHFWKAALALFIFTIGIAGITYRPEVDPHLPLLLAPALNNMHRSLFPMVPFTAFMLIGSFFAYWFWHQKPKGTEWKSMVALIVTGVAFLGLEQAWQAAIPHSSFPLPWNTFARAGCAMIVIGGLFFLEKKVVILSRLSLTMSKDSLAIYVVHLPIIYGGTLGILQAHKRGMAPGYVFLYIAALVALMVGMAWLINWIRTRYPAQLTQFRRTLLLAWTLMFLVFPERSWLAVGLSLAAAVFFMFSGQKKSVAWFRGMLTGNGKTTEVE